MSVCGLRWPTDSHKQWQWTETQCIISVHVWYRVKYNLDKADY